jgi:hypothetical protein
VGSLQHIPTTPVFQRPLQQLQQSNRSRCTHQHVCLQKAGHRPRRPAIACESEALTLLTLQSR